LATGADNTAAAALKAPAARCAPRRKMFVAHRQFASSVGLEELKAVHVRLPSGSLVTENGTLVFPAVVWDKNKLLVTEQKLLVTEQKAWAFAPV
jgi:hypothetical protein